MTEMMKQLSERGLAPDSYEKPVRPSRLVRRETFSAYKSVAEERETWSKSSDRHRPAEIPETIVRAYWQEHHCLLLGLPEQR